MTLSCSMCPTPLGYVGQGGVENVRLHMPMNIFLMYAAGSYVHNTKGSFHVTKGFNLIYVIVWVLDIIGDDAERAS